MAKMKKCKTCGEEIAKSAKVCPKCGAKFGLPGIVKVLIVFFIIIFCVVGCVNSCSNAVDESINESKNAYKDVNGKTEFNVGESFENKYIKITLDSVNENYTKISKYASLKSGYKVVAFDFTGKNVSDEDEKLFSYVDFKCYADDESMNQFYSVEDESNNGLNFIHTLSAGKTGKGSVYCEVPVSASKVYVEYDSSWFSDGDIIKFNLK